MRPIVACNYGDKLPRLGLKYAFCVIGGLGDYSRHKLFDGAIWVFRVKRADRLSLSYRRSSDLVTSCKQLEQNSFE